jgi:uncharacterized protein with HEPN domain
VSSKAPAQRFEDILENILRIEEFTRGMSGTEFTEDPKTNNAVERCIERISEAARKLGVDAEEMCPAIAWAGLRAIGNILRHEYERIDIGRVWLMVEDDLPLLKIAVESALQTLRSQTDRATN